jgi:hypothetical protein
LLSLFTGLSGKPIFSQNASIPQQRLFWLGTAFCITNLSFSCVPVLQRKSKSKSQSKAQ